ncbi:MAG: hypothetical protein AAGG44_14755 [Planctomycetota bacterium]
MEPSATSPYDALASGKSRPRSLFRSLRFWGAVVSSLVAVVAVPVAFTIGVVLGNTQIYRNLAEHQQSRIENYLSLHPDIFPDISVAHASNGWAYPIGSVPSEVDYDNLSSKLHEMFGDELAERMMNTVDVETAS